MPEQTTPQPAVPIVLKWKGGTTSHSYMHLDETGDRITRIASDGRKGVFAPTGDVTAEEREIWVEV